MFIIKYTQKIDTEFGVNHKNRHGKNIEPLMWTYPQIKDVRIKSEHLSCFSRPEKSLDTLNQLVLSFFSNDHGHEIIFLKNELLFVIIVLWDTDYS